MCKKKNSLTEEKHKLYERIDHSNPSDMSQEHLLRIELHLNAGKVLAAHIDQCPECQREAGAMEAATS